MVENNVTIIGRLTGDAEIRTAGNTDNRVVNFTVAINRPKRKDAEDEADFIRVRAWNSTADFIEKYFRKGSKIGVRGSIRTDSYKNKDGENRSVTYVLADEVCFIESKSTSNGGSEPKAKASTKKANVDVTTDDDDLPF